MNRVTVNRAIAFTAKRGPVSKFGDGASVQVAWTNQHGVSSKEASVHSAVFLWMSQSTYRIDSTFVY